MYFEKKLSLMLIIASALLCASDDVAKKPEAIFNNDDVCASPRSQNLAVLSSGVEPVVAALAIHRSGLDGARRAAAEKRALDRICRAFSSYK